MVTQPPGDFDRPVLLFGKSGPILITFPETNVAPENRPSQNEIRIPTIESRQPSWATAMAVVFLDAVTFQFFFKQLLKEVTLLIKEVTYSGRAAQSTKRPCRSQDPVQPSGRPAFLHWSASPIFLWVVLESAGATAASRALVSLFEVAVHCTFASSSTGL